MGNRKWTAVAVVATGLAATACATHSTTPGSPANPASPARGVRAAATVVLLRTERTGLGTVLANGQGHTLYWFALDTPTSSQCSGACLTAWPAVRGTPRMAAGAKAAGTLGDLKRSDGFDQATWDGHPLYTFYGDTAPRQTSGNLVNAFGGVWHAAVIPAAPASASPRPARARSASPSPSPSRT